MVSSHNDLKPQNIRFDGKHIWLVDWESAFLNDRYADLAVVANFFVKDEAHEEEYLTTYFGEPVERISACPLLPDASGGFHVLYGFITAGGFAGRHRN